MSNVANRQTGLPPVVYDKVLNKDLMWWGCVWDNYQILQHQTLAYICKIYKLFIMFND